MALIDELFAKAFGSNQELGQTVRLRAFRAAHPEWVITRDSDMDVWRAFKRLRNGSEDVIRHDLEELLDKLDEKMGV
jgi:hypothetical protein